MSLKLAERESVKIRKRASERWSTVFNHEFVGDFVLASVGQDTMFSIEDVLKNSMEMYEKNRKSFSKRIIIYRSGASEGSHPSILAYEIPLSRAIIHG
ncbi:hypothetical protein B9Z55_025138 [Caenorhabditis nigoni]|uniref:Piwi domain-containing protein n=1 Tax=Caenorhabditis nigoni TaxID=1611254 RepID=A0A2G5SXS8_9PELO|nr:hypothetical protein B9Z55_025138 [Caenorhabditis nigoni]